MHLAGPCRQPRVTEVDDGSAALRLFLDGLADDLDRELSLDPTVGASTRALLVQLVRGL